MDFELVRTWEAPDRTRRRGSEQRFVRMEMRVLSREGLREVMLDRAADKMAVDNSMF